MAWQGARKGLACAQQLLGLLHERKSKGSRLELGAIVVVDGDGGGVFPSKLPRSRLELPCEPFQDRLGVEATTTCFELACARLAVSGRHAHAVNDDDDDDADD